MEFPFTEIDSLEFKAFKWPLKTEEGQVFYP